MHSPKAAFRFPHRTRFFPLLLSLALAAPCARGADTTDDRFLETFAPFRTSTAALSPDGLHLACSVRERDRVTVRIVEVDRPQAVKARVDIGSDADATSKHVLTYEKTPLVIEWMGWVSSTRLVVLTNRCARGVFLPERDPFARPPRSEMDEPEPFNPLARRSPPVDKTTVPPERPLSIPPPQGGIVAIDISGETRVLLEPDGLHVPGAYLRPRILDFDPENRDSVIITAQGRTRHATVHQALRLNTKTGKLQVLSDDLLENGFVPFYDRLGRVRGGLPDLFRGVPPYEYVVENPRSLKLTRWQKLDAVLQTPTPRFLLTPDNNFGQRAIPLAIDEAAHRFYFASNVGRDTFGIYAVDTTSWKKADPVLEHPAFDLIGAPREPGRVRVPLVFDRYQGGLVGVRYFAQRAATHWFRPELQALQADLESTFPQRSVEILEWNEARDRFLVMVYGPTDPGAFYVCDTKANRLIEFAPRSANPEARKPHPSLAFDFGGPQGQSVRGTLVFPKLSRVRQIPLVVRCAAEPWDPLAVGYRRETVALTQMGFAVLEVESRGAWGKGMVSRDTMKAGYENALLDDIVAAIDYVAPRCRIDRKRIALLGSAYGGYVALRGVQRHPDHFRCAVAINAPTDLEKWVDDTDLNARNARNILNRNAYGDAASLATTPLFKDGEFITKPVCFITSHFDPGSPANLIYSQGKRLANALENRGAKFVSLDLRERQSQPRPLAPTDDFANSVFIIGRTEFAQQLPRATAASYQEIEYFLNTHLYDYAALPGPLQTMPEGPDTSGN